MSIVYMQFEQEEPFVRPIAGRDLAGLLVFLDHVCNSGLHFAQTEPGTLGDRDEFLSNFGASLEDTQLRDAISKLVNFLEEGSQPADSHSPMGRFYPGMPARLLSTFVNMRWNRATEPSPEEGWLSDLNVPALIRACRETKQFIEQDQVAGVEIEGKWPGLVHGLPSELEVVAETARSQERQGRRLRLVIR